MKQAFLSIFFSCLAILASSNLMASGESPIIIHENVIKTLKIDEMDNESSMNVKKGRTVQHVKFSIQNASKQKSNFWIHIDNSRIGHVLLLRNDGERFIAGTDYPLSQWEQVGGNIAFRQSIPPYSLYEYIVYTENDGAINTSINIMGERYALGYFEKFQTLSGLFAGSIFGISVFLLFLGFTNKDVTYFYLAATSTAVALLQINDLGVLYPLWPDHPHLNMAFSIACASVSSYFGCRLARHYLLSQIYSPRIDRFFRAFEWYMMAAIIPAYVLNDHNITVFFIAIPAVSCMFLQIFFSVIQIRNQYRPARLFFIACLLPLIAGFAIALTFTGVIESTTTIRLLPLAGTCIQLTIFAFALGERINWLNNQNNIAREIATQSREESEAKKRFLAQISHELRTPLIGIIGLAEIEQNKELDYSRKTLLDSLHKSATLLLQMINNILELVRLEAGHWHVDKKPFSVRMMLTEVIALYAEKASRKDLSLKHHIHTNIPDVVIGDENIIRKIIYQLMDNAEKFTQQGGIIIMAESVSMDEKSINIRFEILDTGTGFDTADSERLFQPFEIADTSSTRPAQGSGIGLSLCKKFCEILGGDIGCDSQKDSGTIFWFRLPLELATTEQTAAQTNRADNIKVDHHSSPFCVYAAEDDEALQSVLHGIFSKEELRYRIFPNGKQLLEAYIANPSEPDLLLLDWNMPVMNAERTIDLLNQHINRHKLPAVRIAVMTAFDVPPETPAQARNDIFWLKKPVDISMIKNLLIMPEQNNCNIT